MPVSSAYRPEHPFFDLGPDYADAVEPAAFPETKIRFRNDRAAVTVGLDTLTDPEWIAHFARFEPLPGQPGPIAMRYHGHQFRVYNPDLGDGRGFLAGQLRADDGRLLDLGTKGSGQTPWSRGADGRLTLKGGMREVLAAEMLQAQGVPTSRAFSHWPLTDQRSENLCSPLKAMLQSIIPARGRHSGSPLARDSRGPMP